MESNCAQGSKSRAVIKEEVLNLLGCCHALIDEYKTYHEAVCKYTQEPHWPGVAPVIAGLKAESAEVERLITRLGACSDDDYPSLTKIDASQKHLTNTLVARESMWNTIKKCYGLVALDRRFSTSKARRGKCTRPNKVAHGHNMADSVYVHAIVDDGREWLRVINMTEKRLFHELAEAGWEFHLSQSQGDHEPETSSDEDEDEGEEDVVDSISIMEAAAGLVEASRANRLKGACPRISILLSRIDEGKTYDVDLLLHRIRRRLGEMTSSADPEDAVSIAIYCANSQFNVDEPPPLDVAISRLMPAVATANNLTPSVNIDTSMLLAMVSDITHKSVAVQPWHHNQVACEIRREMSRPGEVAHELFEALRDKKMICTREAESAFRRMLGSMGQDSEQARARALMGYASTTDGTSPCLVKQLRALSEYPDAIPDDLRLPVTVVNEDWDMARIDRAVDGGELPTAARFAAQDMSESTPTRAVFFYGWASGHVTVTMNHTAKNRIDRLIERFRTNREEKAPLVWVYRKARRGLNATQKPSSNPQSEGDLSGTDAAADGSS